VLLGRTAEAVKAEYLYLCHACKNVSLGIPLLKGRIQYNISDFSTERLLLFLLSKHYTLPYLF